MIVVTLFFHFFREIVHSKNSPFWIPGLFSASLLWCKSFCFFVKSPDLFRQEFWLNGLTFFVSSWLHLPHCFFLGVVLTIFPSNIWPWNNHNFGGQKVDTLVLHVHFYQCWLLSFVSSSKTERGAVLPTIFKKISNMKIFFSWISFTLE